MKINVRDMVLISLFAGLTAIGAWCTIPLPTPVPFTLQILFCMYSGLLLGSKRGALSQVVYVMMGLAGMPVFSGGSGGISYVAKPTFGYLIGFIICAYLIGKLTEKTEKINIFNLTVYVVLGLFVEYAIGATWLYFNMKFYLTMEYTVKQAVVGGVLPFVVWDLLKGFIAVSTSLIVLPRLRRLGYIDTLYK